MTSPVGKTTMFKNKPNHFRVFFAAASSLILLTMGCGLSSLQANTPNTTQTALFNAVRSTVTAAASNGDESSEDLVAAQANATATKQDAELKQTESASGRSESELAQATVAAPIIAELEVYGLDPQHGKVGWVHDPLTIEVDGYQQMQFGNDHMEITAADFVLAADITWDTQYGTNGCGFMFRSDGNQNKPNQYMVLASRFASGHIVFTALLEGELNNLHDFFPKSEDRSFEWENGTTNRLAIVARGNMIELYTNNVKIGEIDTAQPPTPIRPPAAPLEPPNANNAQLETYRNQLKEYEQTVNEFQSNYQIALANHDENPAIFTDGFLGMIVLSESGRTSCTFTDAWLWLIDE